MMITRRHDLPFFGDVMNSLFEHETFEPIKKLATRHIPSVNISENEKGFMIEVAAPGMKKEDFNVEVTHDTLAIWSEKQNKKEQESGKYAVREFNYTSFKRNFSLPKTVDKSKIEARYEDGILYVSILKRQEEETPTKKIAIS